MAARERKCLLRRQIPHAPAAASTAIGSKYGSGVVHSEGSPEFMKSLMPSQYPPNGESTAVHIYSYRRMGEQPVLAWASVLSPDVFLVGA